MTELCARVLQFNRALWPTPVFLTGCRFIGKRDLAAFGDAVERLLDHGRVLADDPEQDAAASAWLAGALFPVLERSEAKAELTREGGLRQPGLGANGRDIDIHWRVDDASIFGGKPDRRHIGYA